MNNPKKKEKKSALQVNPGIEQPSQINEELFKKMEGNKTKDLSVLEYVDGIKNKNILG